MNNKKLKTMLIVTGLLVIGLLAGQYFLYMQIKKENEHISLLESELSQEDSKQEYLLSMQRTLQNIKPDITNINNSIVPAGGDVAFIESLESYAKLNGLTITIDSLTLEEDASYVPIASVSLKIKAKTTGTWSGTYAFIATLESLPFKIKINRLNVENTASEAGVPQSKAGENWQGTFEMYVLKYK